mmetsp:Transcript_11148/g.23183  ORF Transcript_11148/g.23183 Transcript_11148/m.23183 type:complete len:210 (-) Transcript_11148:931-1560(-)
MIRIFPDHCWCTSSRWLHGIHIDSPISAHTQLVQHPQKSIHLVIHTPNKHMIIHRQPRLALANNATRILNQILPQVILHLLQLHWKGIHHGRQHSHIIGFDIETGSYLQLALSKSVDGVTDQCGEEQGYARDDESIDGGSDDIGLILPSVHCHPIVVGDVFHRLVEYLGGHFVGGKCQYGESDREEFHEVFEYCGWDLRGEGDVGERRR